MKIATKEDTLIELAATITTCLKHGSIIYLDE